MFWKKALMHVVGCLGSIFLALGCWTLFQALEGEFFEKDLLGHGPCFFTIGLISLFCALLLFFSFARRRAEIRKMKKR